MIVLNFHDDFFLLAKLETENTQLRAEIVQLNKTLCQRTKQVQILSQKILDHQQVAEENSKQIEMQRSCTEYLQELLQGMRVTCTVQDWEMDHSAQKVTFSKMKESM